MTRLRLFRNLRTLAYLVVVGSVVFACGFLWWANRTGLPEAWRAGIERELAKQGLHADLDSLTLHPLRGIVARGVVLYTDGERKREFCRLERILLDVDKTKIARGVIQLTKVQVEDADLSLRFEPEGMAAETLEIRGLHGSLRMPGGRMMEVRDVRANVAGVDVALSGKLLRYRETVGPPQEDEGEQGRLVAICQFLRELRNWRFAEGEVPSVRCFVEGDLSDWSTMVARLAVEARGVEKNGHVLEQVSASGNLSRSLLTLDRVRASDARGVFRGRVDYDVWGGEGRFDLSSTVDLPRLLSAWFGLPEMAEVVFGGGQELDAEGDFRVRAGGPPEVRMTGRVRCPGLVFRGVRFDLAEGSFSWREKSLYVRDIVLERPDGRASGKVMVQWPLVRLALDTGLPLGVYRPFFVRHPLGRVLRDFEELPGASVRVSLEGGFDVSDHTAWAFAGQARVGKVAFRGVPLDEAQCELSLSHRELDFVAGRAVFNYRDYPLRKQFGGPLSGLVEAGRIRYDNEAKVVEVVGVSGTAWAAPVVRTFAPKLADSLEVYRFHQPPKLTASGVVDVTPRNRTSLDVGFRTDRGADYDFLGENVTLEGANGVVRVRGRRVVVDDLKVAAFGGPVEARIDVGGDGRLGCEASWSEVSMEQLNATYGLNMNGGGVLTGRIELDFFPGKLETMNGQGLAALERSVLFSAPIAGPLSGVIAAVLNDERAGFERAKDAFLTFTIKNGVLHTKDFHTSTQSLVFTGDGSVDLSKRTLDANVRVNARGLLGLVTLPLRPFAGFFQFRGTGPLGHPEWQDAPFSPPPPEQAEVLAEPPRAVEVGPGVPGRRKGGVR